jgi:hypothetical protein
LPQRAVQPPGVVEALDERKDLALCDRPAGEGAHQSMPVVGSPRLFFPHRARHAVSADHVRISTAFALKFVVSVTRKPGWLMK